MGTWEPSAGRQAAEVEEHSLEGAHVLGSMRWCQWWRTRRRCKSHGLHPWVGKMPWRREGNLLQYSCLENPTDRGAWQATVHESQRVRHDWARPQPRGSGGAVEASETLKGIRGESQVGERPRQDLGKVPVWEWKRDLIFRAAWRVNVRSGQFSSVTQSCLTLYDPMDCSTPGLPVHHQLPEFTQTHVCWVSDAIQPSHPLSSPSPAFSLSQYQGLFQWVSPSYQVAKVLELQLQHQSFQWIFCTNFLQDGLVGPPCSPRDSQKSSPTPQFKSINSSALSLLCGPTLTSIHDYC